MIWVQMTQRSRSTEWVIEAIDLRTELHKDDKVGFELPLGTDIEVEARRRYVSQLSFLRWCGLHVEEKRW